MYKIFILALTISAVYPLQARSHNINVYAYVQGNQIVAEGYFGGKSKAVNCVVKIYDNKEKLLKEGQTDENGKFVADVKDLPAQWDSLKFVLDAGSGHRAEYVLSKNEPAPESNVPQTAVKSVKQEISPTEAQELKPILEQALDEKLRPLMVMIGNQQRLLLEQKNKGPTFTEIIGGVGWIFGLVGAWAFFAGRKENKS
jgi:nickel transport protein